MSRHASLLLLLVCCVTFCAIEATSSARTIFQKSAFALNRPKQYVKPKYTNVFIESAATIHRSRAYLNARVPQEILCYGKKCPFPEGICCPNDRNACCPKGYSCLTKEGQATQCVAGDDKNSQHRELSDLKQNNFNTGTNNPVVVVDIDARRKQEEQAIEKQKEKVAELQAKEEAEKHTAKMEQKNNPNGANPDALAQRDAGNPTKSAVDSPVSQNEVKNEQQTGGQTSANNQVAPSSTSSSSNPAAQKWRPKQNIIIVKNINVLTHGIRMAADNPSSSPATPTSNNNNNNNNAPVKTEP